MRVVRCAAPRDKASKDKRPRCSRAVVLRGSPVGAIAPSASHLRMTGIERQSWQMAHPAFRRPSGHTFTSSRHILPELCGSHRPRRCRGRREGRVPAGTRGPLCANALETDAQRHTGEAKHPAFPAQWFYGLCRALPGERCTIAPVALSMADIRARSGRHITARLGAQTPGARTTRFCRTRAAPVVCTWGVAHGVTRPANRLRADAARVHHIPSRVS